LLKGVLTSGVLRDLDALTVTLECFEENLPDLVHVGNQIRT
jgi:hypothetical protein